MNQDNDITIVTAFLDIGRSDWKGDYKRDPSFYIDSFLTYLNYPYKIVCYVDDKYINNILKTYANSPYQNKLFIPINKTWLMQNIHAWSNIEKDRAIMNSNEYKEFLKQRIPLMRPCKTEVDTRSYLCPENIFPEYNVINHSKIDLIANAINNGYINTTYTAWCDFGYFRTYHSNGDALPITTIDVNKLNPDKITFCLRFEITENDKNILWTALLGNEVFIGAFYAGPTKLMIPFQNTYHDAVNKIYNVGITDDDQHVYIQCYCLNPDIMHLKVFKNQDWPKALVVFSK